MNASRIVFGILGIAMLLAAIAGFVTFANSGSSSSLVLGVAGLVLAAVGFVLFSRSPNRKQ